MKGFWVPISKALAQELPNDRPFSKVEAAYSLQLDYDQGTSVTIAGMAARWQWSRKRVSSFLDELGLMIVYPQSTGYKQNQRGQIALQIGSRSGADEEQIKFLDNKEIGEQESRSGADREQIINRSGSTTKENKRSEKRKESPLNLPLDQVPFTAAFVAGPWAEWCRTKKGGNYRNAEAALKSIRNLYNLSGGDEERAADALETAFDHGWQSFTWVFKNNDQRPKQNGHDQTTLFGNAQSRRNHGADNLTRLESLG